MVVWTVNENSFIQSSNSDKIFINLKVLQISSYVFFRWYQARKILGCPIKGYNFSFNISHHISYFDTRLFQLSLQTCISEVRIQIYTIKDSVFVRLSDRPWHGKLFPFYSYNFYIRALILVYHRNTSNRPSFILHITYNECFNFILRLILNNNKYWLKPLRNNH